MNNGKIVIHILYGQKNTSSSSASRRYVAVFFRQAEMNSEPEALFVATKQVDVLVANG